MNFKECITLIKIWKAEKELAKYKPLEFYCSDKSDFFLSTLQKQRFWNVTEKKFNISLFLAYIFYLSKVREL